MSHMPGLEPEQVVHASMAGVARGEVVCIPTLDDPALPQRHDEADQGLFTSGMRPILAPRYLNEHGPA